MPWGKTWADIATKQENNAKRASTPFHLRNVDFLVSSSWNEIHDTSFSSCSLYRDPFPPHNSQPWSSLKYSSTVLSRFSFRSLSIIALDKSEVRSFFFVLSFFFFFFHRQVRVASSRSFNRKIKFLELTKKVRGRQIDRVRSQHGRR